MLMPDDILPYSFRIMIYLLSDFFPIFAIILIVLVRTVFNIISLPHINRVFRKIRVLILIL